MPRKDRRFWPDYLNFKSSENLWDDEDISMDPLVMEKPYPCHDPLPCDHTDIVLNVYKEKAKYLKIKEQAKRECKSNTDNLLHGKKNDAVLPMNLMYYYKSEDPDPYLTCDYNFYYTGGCLEYFQLNGHDYLIRPTVKNDLCITDVSDQSNFTVPDFRTSSPICAIRSYSTDSNVLSVLRERNNISIVNIQNDFGLQVQPLYSKESRKFPFMDAKLDLTTQLIAISNADLYLALYDIEEDKKVRHFNTDSFKNSIDCLSQIEFVDENVFVFGTRSKFGLFDCRSSKTKGEYEVQVEPCNSVCVFKVRDNDLIVGTRHDLRKYDVRYFQESEYCSHMLAREPCYLDVSSGVDDTLICLSSQQVEQKVLFGSTAQNKLPLEVPSVLDTLRECRLKKDILLKPKLEKILSYSVTGIKILDDYDGKALYSTNCVGQIFKQTIGIGEIMHSEAVERLHDWVQKMPSEEQELHATGIVDMSSVWFKMTDAPIGKKRKEPKTMDELFLVRFGRKFRTDNYCDLAGEFMSIWQEGNGFGELPEKQAEASSKVNDWLTNHDFLYVD